MPIRFKQQTETMKKLAVLLSFILTSCNMFYSEAPYKRFFSEKEYPIIEAIHNYDKDKLLEMMRQGWNVNSTGKHATGFYAPYTIREQKKHRESKQQPEVPGTPIIQESESSQAGQKKPSSRLQYQFPRQGGRCSGLFLVGNALTV